MALSSTEAEYVRLSEAVKGVIHLRSLLNELGFEKLTETTLNVGNNGTKCLAGDPVYHSRIKRIDIA